MGITFTRRIAYPESRPLSQPLAIEDLRLAHAERLAMPALLPQQVEDDDSLRRQHTGVLIHRPLDNPPADSEEPLPVAHEVISRSVERGTTAGWLL